MGQADDGLTVFTRMLHSAPFLLGVNGDGTQNVTTIRRSNMRRTPWLPLFGGSLVLFLVTAAGAQAQTQQEELGRKLYLDTNLSEPAGQGCVSCHDPAFGFVDPVNVTTGMPVSQGVVPGRFGNRHSPSAAYAVFSPLFTLKGGIQGGQFWDGRASDLAAQARGPFLNPVEMNNTTRGQVIGKIQTSPFEGEYAVLFEQVCGPNAFASENVDRSYVCMSEAIAAFEGTTLFRPFTSKFDAVQAGRASFTAQEQSGLDLFTGNGKCAHCHTVNGGGGRPVLFTDFKYHNIGLPENRRVFELVGARFTDLGLGGFLNDPRQNGKFKNPHLRNIGLTPPFMHNGVLSSLKQVVHFYNTRDVLPKCDPAFGNLDPGFGVTCWAAPEIPGTMDSSFLGNLRLTDAEEDAIVAFMLTLTDGSM
jgi:cytochrome c peroxidase